MDNGIFLSGGEFGILLLHGFTASDGQMRELAEALGEQGFTVRAPLLPGHGAPAEALENVSWYDWIAAARRDYTELCAKCSRVAVGGLSMGGALATLLAEEYPVEALLLYAPCVKMKQKTAWAARLAKPVRLYAKNAAGERSFPLSKGYDLWKLTVRAMMGAFSVLAPTLIFQPERDDTIDKRGAQRLCSAISAPQKELVWLQNSPHTCLAGPEKQEIIEKSVHFLVRVRADAQKDAQ